MIKYAYSITGFIITFSLLHGAYTDTRRADTLTLGGSNPHRKKNTPCEVHNSVWVRTPGGCQYVQQICLVLSVVKRQKKIAEVHLLELTEGNMQHLQLVEDEMKTISSVCY
ncbi:hypothetical protein ES288_D11G147400v1 [Gossypium darwinii]|uniref:Uncharacterized protein n=1 Tax=Gossypium darwinii TaxID=34276 RepID=A0A5D2AKQ4_GOSDA|nr:hypothetical protein ES288_D11G147400v1 [Gossypium darwinii]